MHTTTPRLNLPLLQAGQAMKHIIHNLALARLDALTHLEVVSDSAAPPDSPQAGDHFIVPRNSDWPHAADSLVVHDGTRWERLDIPVGLTAYVSDRAALVVFSGEGWSDVGLGGDGGGTGTHPASSASMFGVNAQADTQNRLSVTAPATLFNAESGSHRLAINRTDPGEVASVVFQTGFAGGAEFGLLGDAGFTLKVSGDGTHFVDALQVSPSGDVGFPRGLDADLRPGRVAASGGAGEIMGAPNAVTLALGRTSLNISADQIYMSAFFVDRPVELLGAAAALNSAASTVGSLLRCGLYRLGGPDGDDWQVGERVVDYGTHAADTAGHKRFDLDVPLALERGWYLHAVGISGEDAQLRAVEWITPATAQYAPTGSDEGADLRVTGMTYLMVMAGQTAAIVNGLPAQFADGFTDLVTTRPYALQPLLPIWRPV